MRISSKIFALCLFQARETSAFVCTSTPRALNNGHHTTLYSTPSAMESQIAQYSNIPDVIQRNSPGGILTTAAETNNRQYDDNNIPNNDESIIIQGGALRTWTFPTPHLERVLVNMSTEGRHLNALVTLCQGPDNTPQKMEIRVGKGKLRPFSAVIETPGGCSAVFIRNIAPLEYPISANIQAEVGGGESGIGVANSLYDMSFEDVVQGGSVRTYEFDPSVQSVKCILKTDGRPLNARLELIQGPNSVRETIGLYTEDGMQRPLFTVIETPGIGNSVRIVNTAPMEFPLVACVEPLVVETESGLSP